MIPEAIFGAILICAPIKIINNVESTTELTTADVDHLTRAKKRCGQIYKDSPCVVRFYVKLDEWGHRMYNVVCRAKDHKEKVWLP